MLKWIRDNRDIQVMLLIIVSIFSTFFFFMTKQQHRFIEVESDTYIELTQYRTKLLLCAEGINCENGYSFYKPKVPKSSKESGEILSRLNTLLKKDYISKYDYDSFREYTVDVYEKVEEEIEENKRNKIKEDLRKERNVFTIR